jgi:hypothetical protein
MPGTGPDPGWINSLEYRTQLEDEHREDRCIDEALRRRYPDAILRHAEFELRARAHGVRFSPHMAAHHVAAFLDYLDDPGSVAPSAFQALNFQACNPDGTFNGSMTHPVNRAQFTIMARHAQLHRWKDDHYTPERAAWSSAQWRAHERKEKDRYDRAVALSIATGCPVTLSSTNDRHKDKMEIRYDI